MDLRDIYARAALPVVPIAHDGTVLCRKSSRDLQQMRAWQREFPKAGIGLWLNGGCISVFEDITAADFAHEPYDGFIRTARVCAGRKQYTLITRNEEWAHPQHAISTGVFPLPPSVVNRVAYVWRRHYNLAEVSVAQIGTIMRRQRRPESYLDVRLESEQPDAKLAYEFKVARDVLALLKKSKREMSEREIEKTIRALKAPVHHALAILRKHGDVSIVRPFRNSSCQIGWRYIATEYLPHR